MRFDDYKSGYTMADVRTLNAAMPNELAWRMGEIALQAGSASRTDVGDPIDRGLILLRDLNQNGFSVTFDFDKAHTR